MDVRAFSSINKDKSTEKQTTTELWKPAVPNLFGRRVALLRTGDPVLLGKA